jgi:hypothetical protein
MTEFNVIIELQKLVDKYKFNSISLENELQSQKNLITKLKILVNKQDDKILYYKNTLLELGLINDIITDSESELDEDSDPVLD